ncbi:DUF2480 family protein [Echinicola vietnamensis]|uniref:DUF2480 family protein n=1 Tax=Echinicola vietnamensis (strain DSM 17526 / LMG 23754 / KMM 6221) TaxID=926556 RepID=L0FYF1_ECHVK|nr:DUF2480 family protein [Echinicola vietnamensis]AGA78053.1 Protein of unknown function (DUF2480) [Echinicola vietnamensis DSM 17526]
MSEIVNRVANSPIVTIDLEEYYGQGTDRVLFDLKVFLFQELVLKERDFRKALKELDWEQYRGKFVAVDCTVDAIVPTWAYMLVVTYLEGVAKDVAVGSVEDLERYLFQKALMAIDPATFEGRPVVIKGCSKFPVPIFAYGEVVRLLKGKAKSIMYGEPCSTVPVYKRPK